MAKHHPFEIGQVLDMTAAQECYEDDVPQVSDPSIRFTVVEITHEGNDTYWVKLYGGGKQIGFSTCSYVAEQVRILPQTQIFIRKDSHGMAVIRAKSPAEALKLLRAYEGEDENLVFNATIVDFTRVAEDGHEAVLAYVSE